MWPWGHAAVGYLLYVGWAQFRYGEWPQRSSIVAVLMATQLPDLIDKPLAWSFHVLPSGRSFAHSLLVAIPLVILITFMLSQVVRFELTTPIVIGYFSHIVTDLPSEVLHGEFAEASFLLWPLLPPPEYSTDPSFGAHLAKLRVSSDIAIEASIAGMGILLLIFNLFKCE